MLNLIRTFIKVVEHGSFSKAGAVLNMAPSSIARNIDSLEQQLQITLLKRSTRQLILTEDGEAFLQGANKLLCDADMLIASVKGEKTEPAGIIKISAFESFSRLHLTPILAEFLEKHPEITIEIDIDNKMVDLISEDVDLAIRIGKPEDSSLKARVLFENHTAICTSPGYLSKHGTPKTPEELEQHNCLLLGHNRQRIYWHFKKGQQTKKIAVKGNLISKGGSPLLEAALQGAGIVQLSNWILSDAIKKGDLKVCLADWKSSLFEETSGDVYAVYVASKYPDPALRTFIDYLVEKINSSY